MIRAISVGAVLGVGGADIVGRVEVLVLVSAKEGCVADEGEADECLAGSAELEGTSASMRRFCG